MIVIIFIMAIWLLFFITAGAAALQNDKGSKGFAVGYFLASAILMILMVASVEYTRHAWMDKAVAHHYATWTVDENGKETWQWNNDIDEAKTEELKAEEAKPNTSSPGGKADALMAK